MIPADLDTAIANTRVRLLSLRDAAGHWEGELSSSALSTATAIVGLSLVDANEHAFRIARGRQWLITNQNADGGWGDTTVSKSNLSTTLLCWSALSVLLDGSSPRRGTGPVPLLEGTSAVGKCELWLRSRVGSLEPDAICRAVVARYGKDRTFSVPILMTCAIGGRLGPPGEAWRRVLALPFELAAFPRSWFGAIGLPVVSYALPALIAIGYARFFHAPPRWWDPRRWWRALLWPRVSPMLRALQPATGGYLEATPLTSFVTMALAASGQTEHPCVPGAVEFLLRSQHADGSWAIDTNLATWVTTLAVKAGACNADTPVRGTVRSWLLAQQYQEIHPFTNAAPGGWAWTDLPGGVPDADDTSGALIALWHLSESEPERREILPAIDAGVIFLLGLQNRDGGMPTFCRGWGTLPFDRSTPEITAHALWAWSLWLDEISPEPRSQINATAQRALDYLARMRRPDGSWVPLWFGNERARNEENPVHGTAMVLLGIAKASRRFAPPASLWGSGIECLVRCQAESGGWGGEAGAEPTIEETANAVKALANCLILLPGAPADVPTLRESVRRGAEWLCRATQGGTVFSPAPIGLYFARLWYYEKLYPVIWTLGALESAKVALSTKSG